METSSVNRKSTARTVCLAVGTGLAAIAVLLGWYLSFPLFLMPSASMEKSVMMGEGVIVDRISTFLGRPLKRGDVIVFFLPTNRKEVYTKRVVGIPGDRLRIRDKHLFRDGVEVQEPYAQHVTPYIDAYRDNFPSSPNMRLPERVTDMLERNVVNGELVLPGGQYFVLGDNRDDSLDSRYWGFIRRSDVIGRAIRIYSSPDPSRFWKPVN